MNVQTVGEVVWILMKQEGTDIKPARFSGPDDRDGVLCFPSERVAEEFKRDVADPVLDGWKVRGFSRPEFETICYLMSKLHGCAWVIVYVGGGNCLNFPIPEEVTP